MQTHDPSHGLVDPALAHAAWAEATFRDCDLPDARLRRRLVQVAAGIARNPQVSLSRAFQDPAALKAGYRLVHHDAATIAAVTEPHRRQTLAAAGSAPGVVLMVQDTTEFDYSQHPATTGLGPIGDGRGRGFLVQSVLAIRPALAGRPVPVLGVAHLEAFDRVPAPHPQETSAQKRTRPRESDCWLRAVDAVGRPPAGVRWVLVGDRGADAYRLFAHCRAQGQDLLVRAVQDRRARDAEGLPTGVLRTARTQSPGSERREVAIPAKPTQRARTASVAVAWTALTLRPPAGMTEMPALPIWVVHVWEPDPPDGGAPLEWILLSSVAVETEAAAWERVDWYRQRWVVEEYHQALKTGCGLEAAQLRDQASLWALLGICAPIAIRLLQLRALARGDPAAAATTVLDAQTIAVLAALTKTNPAGMSAGTCWKLIARLGGHLGRKGDGEPGWKTLWWGWQHLQTVLDGVRIAAIV